MTLSASRPDRHGVPAKNPLEQLDKHPSTSLANVAFDFGSDVEATAAATYVRRTRHARGLTRSSSQIKVPTAATWSAGAIPPESHRRCYLQVSPPCRCRTISAPAPPLFRTRRARCSDRPRRLVAGMEVLCDAANLPGTPDRLVVAVACWSSDGLGPDVTGPAHLDPSAGRRNGRSRSPMP